MEDIFAEENKKTQKKTFKPISSGSGFSTPSSSTMGIPTPKVFVAPTVTTPIYKGFSDELLTFSHPIKMMLNSDWNNEIEVRFWSYQNGKEVTSLTEILFDKIKFLLDTTLGFINVNQNKIIKMFSVASVMFLPPTMVASVYGMNFEFMPELKWQHGYLFGLFLMFLSAVVPFLYFKRRRWL